MTINNSILPFYTGAGTPVAGNLPAVPIVPSHYFDSTGLRLYRSKYSNSHIIWSVVSNIVKSTVDPTVSANASTIATIATQEDTIIYGSYIYSYIGSAWVQIGGSSTLPQIQAIMSIAAAKSTLPDGLVIFQVIPTDGLPSGINLNDIVTKAGTTYTLPQSYASAPASIAIGLTSATAITYDKDGNGSWQSPVPLINAVNNSSNKNYLLAYNGNFETGLTAPWYPVTVPMTGSVPTGATTSGSGNAPVSGTTSITTFNIISTGQLAGKYSLQTACATAWNAGDGFASPSITIDQEDQGKLLSIKGYYKPTIGTFNFTSTSPTLQIWIWDTANLKFISPVNPSAFTGTSSNLSGILNAQFQTSSNMTSFQLVVLCVNSSTAAVTMLFDDFAIGPQAPATIGAVITDWLTAPPVNNISNIGSKGTTTVDFFNYRREGDSMNISSQIAATGGSSGSGVILWNLPNGLQIDTTKIPASTNLGFSIVGSGVVSNTLSVSTNYAFIAQVQIYSSTQLALYLEGPTSQQGQMLSSNYLAWGNPMYVSFTATVPILGWSSGLALSSNVPQGRVSAFYYVSSSQSVASGQPINFDTKVEDTYNAITTGTNSWRFTAPFTMDYIVDVLIDGNATSNFQCYINGIPFRYVGSISASGTGVPIDATFKIYLQQGQYLDIRPGTALSMYGSASVPYITSINIFGIGSNQTIATDPSVNANYETAAGQALTTTATVIPFNVFLKDTHSAYNTTTGIYICPISGTYNVHVKLRTTAVTLMVAFSITINVYVNGTLYKELFYNMTGMSLANGSVINIEGGLDIPNCIAGYTQIAIYAVTTGGTINLSTTANQNYLEVKRIGS